MFNIRIAATIVAGVTVAGASAKQIFDRTRKDVVTTELETTPVLTSRLTAFNLAQDEISSRMLDGYYDDCPDSVPLHDFDILFANFMSN